MNRKIKLTTILLIIILLFGMTSCGKQEKQRYEGEFLQLFDTATRIIGYTDSKEIFGEYVQDIYDELEIYHELYDIYNDYEGINNVKTINDKAGIEPVKVDQRIIDMIKFGVEVEALSKGNTNIALGAVLKIWHDYREEGHSIPSMEELEAAALHVDIKDVVIDEENSTIFLKDPLMSLDVGGIAKGYATEQVSRYIIEKGFKDGIISVGGNVRTFGQRGDTGLWKVGVQNPDMSEDSLLMIGITDKSLVTSGDYIRNYVVDGKVYHHIIDPDTLMPSEFFTSISIVCEDSGMADALSTIIYNMSFEEGLDLIESLDDTEAFWVFRDGRQEYSSGFEVLIQ